MPRNDAYAAAVRGGLAQMLAEGNGAIATAHQRGEHGIFGPDCLLCMDWLLREVATRELGA
jgi:hypothetical protein